MKTKAKNGAMEPQREANRHLKPQEEMSCQHLNFKLLVSRTVRE
jgi:hypothetical protein